LFIHVNLEGESVRCQFSLRDLFVLLTISAVLFAFGVPFLIQKREHSRQLQCTQQLKSIGINFQLFCQRDPMGRYCSGPYVFQSEAPPDQLGWVADMMKLGGIAPNEMLCPVNNVRGLSPLNDWIAHEQQAAGNIDAVVNSVANGMNTNYTQNWIVGHGSWKLQRLESDEAICQGDQRKIEFCTGPFSNRMMHRVTESALPMIGDASAQSECLSGWRDSFSSPLQNGVALGIPIGNGPVCYDVEAREYRFISEISTVQTRLHVALLTHRNFDSIKKFYVEKPYMSVADRKTKLANLEVALKWRPAFQDTHHFNPIHVDTLNRASCNMLFADGSVRAIYDKDGDGWINPGFAQRDPTQTYKNHHPVQVTDEAEEWTLDFNATVHDIVNVGAFY
jgi:prepilin-type processing-associated H-X9-DG protein